MNRLTRLTRCLRSAITRAYSTGVDVTFDSTTGYAVLQMNNPPVNAFSLEFMNIMNSEIDKLEVKRDCRGIIITSAIKDVFSAGLDILEMYQPDVGRLAIFWRAFQELWYNIYTSKFVVMAAINGNSPAGGCIVTNATDYRIMADSSYKIGLNETRLGLTAPPWAVDNFLDIVGYREAEMALQLGHMYSAQEALKVGLVDELVPPDAVLDTAMQTMTKWLTVPEYGRQITKMTMRQNVASKFLLKREEDIENFVTLVHKDSVQKILETYLKKLKDKNK